VLCRYPLSKLFEVLFVRELVKHTEKVPIITTVNPGFCKSELGRDGAPFLALIKFFRYLFARSTEVGSRTLLAGACAGEGSHGMYMSDCENQNVAPWIETEDGARVQKKVYEQTLAVLERIEPGISKNI
jgi:retinol dehydrogenase-12